jgi:ABC-type multidrug transport system fused ATPase/permease subunit
MGHTGVGKTTLFRLLLGLAEPTSGTISIYDDTRRLRINTETRRYMVFVPQGNTLMSGTVRYNLLLARPDASDDELRSVLHIAMADFVMDMPDGLDTVLGERSAGLSEGQAQRIAIARGLLRPGKILLLDEISSALDEQTESELFKRLFEAYPDKTVLMITHRQGVANLCDKIVTLG